MSGDWGLKIAQVGFDVKVCADNELVYTSEYPQLKIHSTDRGTYSATGSEIYGFSTTLSTHNLGYKPFFIVYLKLGSVSGVNTISTTGGTYRLNLFGTSKVNTLVMGMVSIDTSNPLWEEPEAPSDPLSIDYSWIIFYDPVKDE